VDLAGVDGEGQAVQGVNMTEVLVQAVHFYDVLHVRLRRAPRRSATTSLAGAAFGLSGADLRQLSLIRRRMY
jgi:hypothetical protein